MDACWDMSVAELSTCAQVTYHQTSGEPQRPPPAETNDHVSGILRYFNGFQEIAWIR